MIPHLRAAFVLFHLAVVTFVAMPAPGSAMNRQAWRQPTVQGEFQAWSERLAGLGLVVPPAELEARAWDFATAYEGARQKLLRPLRPWLDVSGTWQSWKMFVAPHRYPARMEIDVTTDGRTWTPVYAARSDELDWMRPWLDHDRMRAALFRYAWEHYRTPRKEFADWVAVRAAEDFPEAVKVRVSFVRYRTRSPEEVRAGTPPAEKRELVQVRELGAP